MKKFLISFVGYTTIWAKNEEDALARVSIYRAAKRGTLKTTSINCEGQA